MLISSNVSSYDLFSIALFLHLFDDVFYLLNAILPQEIIPQQFFQEPSVPFTDDLPSRGQ